MFENPIVCVENLIFCEMDDFCHETRNSGTQFISDFSTFLSQNEFSFYLVQKKCERVDLDGKAWCAMARERIG